MRFHLSRSAMVNMGIENPRIDLINMWFLGHDHEIAENGRNLDRDQEKNSSRRSRSRSGRFVT